MKARAYILTISTSLALIAPAAHAAGTAGNALSCAPHTKDAASNTGTSRKSLLSPQSSRALQYVVLGDGATTNQPIRTPCGAKKITTAITPNHFQVQRDAL
jgi:hypothetical protein